MDGAECDDTKGFAWAGSAAREEDRYVGCVGVIRCRFHDTITSPPCRIIDLVPSCDPMANSRSNV
jgi:hypothetical protein